MLNSVPHYLFKKERTFAFEEIVERQEMMYFIYILEVLSTENTPASRCGEGGRMETLNTAQCFVVQ